MKLDGKGYQRPVGVTLSSVLHAHAWVVISRLKKYPKYNYIPQPQSSVGVLDKLYSVTYDKFVFAFHLEVSSHFSLNSSKYFAPPRLEEELGKSLSYEFNQCTVCATIRP